jgi:hypothetical protein
MAEHLNAQQVAQIEGKIRLAIEQAINGMNLRKLALETAADLVGGRSITPLEFAEFATGIYEFLTSPAADIKVTLE